MSGNKKPQTFRNCEHCGERYGPLDHLARRFCSQSCKIEAQRVAQPKPRAIGTKAARRAQRRIRYLVECGRVVKPLACEECDVERFLEAAHYDYERPEDVRWLCVPCHRRWDLSEPKGGTR